MRMNGKFIDFKKLYKQNNDFPEIRNNSLTFIIFI